jgi:signal transduction histidine kinase
MGDASREVRSRFDRLEQTVARLPDGPERAPLAEGVHALREAMDRLEELDRDERRHLGHDLRVPLNAIAGWTHTSGSTRPAPARCTGRWTSSTGMCGP